MTNSQVLRVTIYSLRLQMMEDQDRHRRTDIRLRIDDRDLRLVSDYKHRHYDVIDAETGELIAIQPAEDSLTEIDSLWLNKECETLYNTID